MYRLIAPAVVLLMVLLYLIADSPQFRCPQGQIYLARGFGGACVVGSWR